MKRKAIAAAACSLIFIAAFFGTITLLKAALPSGAARAADAIAAETNAAFQAEDKYIIKEYGGNICVFYGDFQDIPAIITEIAVDSLTANDKELMSQGIVVYGRQELLKLLEDYS